MSTAQSPLLSDRRLIVVMGVSGSGKSTIGEGAAERLGIPFIDADDLHPQANVEKMSGGAPLEDEDRWPWLDIVANAMRDAAETHGRVICACSALKRSYRDFLSEKAGERMGFVLLHGAREVIAQRQSSRKGHFMPPSLLDSQFATLETFGPGEIGSTIDVDQTIEEIVEETVELLTAPPQRVSIS